jgi:hypothetical protein
MKNQIMYPFNDREKAFLYKLKDVFEKISACRKKSSGRPEKCEMATNFQTFLNKFDALDYNIRRFVPFL